MLEPASQSWSFVEAAHLLRRVGFSGTIQEVKQLHAMGRFGAINFLVDASLNEPLPALPKWSNIAAAKQEAKQYFEQEKFLRNKAKGTPPGSETQTMLKDFRRQRKRLNEQRASEGLEWWFKLMCAPSCALRERLVLFWHDHFATGLRKVREPILMLRQNQLFRSHAAGNFCDLVRGVMDDPAMVQYLDLQQSSRQHPNENFARELLELFTLGEGQYQEQDILELAKALTGITLKNYRLEVGFDQGRHDEGRKRIFGRSKDFTPQEALDWVLEQPQMAEYLVSKLWKYFAGIELPAHVCKQLARSFREQHEYQLAPFLKQLFGLRAFYHPRVMRQQIKSPIAFLASFCRQFRLAGIPRSYLIGSLSKLRHVPFMPPNVAGWEGGRSWINADSLLARYNMVGELMRPGWRGPRMAGRSGDVFAIGKQREEMKDWRGPDWKKVFPLEERKDLPLMLNWLLFSLYGENLANHKRESILQLLENSAKEEESGLPSDNSLAELCELLCCTPEYQLA